jgi:hypothetical protein
MRSIFLIGGLFGFLLSAGTSWQAGHAPDRILLDAAVGCLAGALLARWLWTVVLRGLRETILKRQEAAVAAPAAKPKA